MYFIIQHQYFSEIFSVFKVGLSKPTVATMAEGRISTSDLSVQLYRFWVVYLRVLTKDDDDVQNYDDVGEVSNEADRDSGSIYASNDKSYIMKPEEEQLTLLSV